MTSLRHRGSGSAHRFEIKPFAGALPLRFGMSLGEVKDLLGDPVTAEQDRGEYEMVYGDDACIRVFVGAKGLLEIGFAPSDGLTVLLDGQDVFRDPHAFERAVRASQEAFEYMGFVVLADRGIAFTGFHDADESQKAVTIFSRGRWDKFLRKAKPFSLNAASSRRQAKE